MSSRFTSSAVIALAVTLAAAACTSSGRGESAPSAASANASGASSPAAIEPAETAARCPSVRAHAGGRSDATLTVPGAAPRHYILTVPSDYDGVSRLPLVVNLHGYGANAEEQLLYSRLGTLADSKRFVVATLDGQGNPRHYNVRPTTFGGEVSDVVVVRRLVDEIDATLCIDARRTFATGMSAGGVLAAALGCYASDRFAAVAPVAALFYDPTCDKASPVAVMAFRGTADDVVPYAGGQVSCCGHPTVRPAETDIADWARHNGCSAQPAVSSHGDVRMSAYRGCTLNADVVLNAIIGGGHTWPGAIALPGLGLTSRDIDATRAMWEFFAAHPKPGR